MSTKLEEIVGALAVCSGTALGGVVDGHARWSLYQRSLGNNDCLPYLLDVVSVEPDANIALGIVLQVMGKLAPPDRQMWISQLHEEKSREYASRRARELGIYQSRAVAELLGDGVEQSWSDWLQLLLAEFSDEREVLQRMAEAGRTKRIRRMASERLKIVESSQPQGLEGKSG